MACRYPGVACYWLEPNGRYRVGLRRFTFSEGGAHGHDASTITDRELPARWSKRDGHEFDTLEPIPKTMLNERGLRVPAVPGHRSTSWPRRCEECGEPFPRDAEWQAFQALGYTRSDTGETIWARHIDRREHAGALYDAPWLHDWPFDQPNVGADGIALIAVCPNGAPWRVDGPATGGGRWTRTGDPRQPATLTVTPSIRAGDYHGFLQAGRFTDDLGS